MMENKRSCEKWTDSSSKGKKQLVDPIDDSLHKKYSSGSSTEENIPKQSKRKKQREKANSRTKIRMRFSIASDNDSSTDSESGSISQQRLKVRKKAEKCTLKTKRQLKETNGEVSESTLDGISDTKKSERRYATLSEILRQNNDENEDVSSSAEESEISKFSLNSYTSMLSNLKRDLKVFHSKQNERKTAISGEQSLLFKSHMVKALNTFKEACSEFELQMEHVKWRYFKKDLTYRENASNVLNKSRKVITSMKRELEKQENELISFYNSWCGNCGLENLEETSMERDKECSREESLVSKCTNEDVSRDLFDSILEETMDKHISGKSDEEDEGQQNDFEEGSSKKMTQKRTKEVSSVKHPWENKDQSCEESCDTTNLTEVSTKSVSTDNAEEKEKDDVTAPPKLDDDEERIKKAMLESDSESQHDEESTSEENKKIIKDVRRKRKTVDATRKMSIGRKNSSDENEMVSELEFTATRSTMDSDENPSWANNSKDGEEELDDDNANNLAKTALLISSNSDTSSSESFQSVTTEQAKSSDEKSTRTDKKSSLKRVYSSESESSIIVAIKKRRTKPERTNSLNADEKLAMSCHVYVERLSEKILADYAKVLRNARERLKLKEMKNLIDLDRLEKDQKGHSKNSSKGSSKKKEKEKTADEMFWDHLKRVENGEPFDDTDVEPDSDDIDRITQYPNLFQSNQALLLEADKAVKNALLNSSDSDVETVKATAESSGSEDEKNKTVAKSSTKKMREKKDRKNSSSDSDKREEREKSKWRRNKLLTIKLSDSDSDAEKEKCKAKQEKLRASSEKGNASTSDMEEEVVVVRKKRTRRRIIDSDSDIQLVQSDSESDNSESSKNSDVKEKPKRRTRATCRSSNTDSSQEEKKTKPRKKRIKKMDSDSDSDNDDDDDDQMNSSQGASGKKGRKNIRKVMKDKQVASDTKQAAKEEEERMNRIAERQKLYNEMYEARLAGEEKVDKLVLDFNPVTKEELISVHEGLVRRLKPHQAKGIKFMWDACFETLERTKTSTGSGCIIAHCMGLGKTLQVITLIHTLLNYEETGIKTVMVVCPLSTVLNWVNEFDTWLSNIDNGDLEIYELTKFKKNIERAYQLQSWQRTGGVLIIGYEMFRNLSGPCKNMRKKMKAEILECLINPGPDLVVCDEGHLLKNEDTALSKSMRRIKTLRRIVLTGTPLQNNLVEYHCMVQFVKPNLLGTRREFLNRFVNPITNGQFDDSTEHDVKLMKKRAYVLNKMLKGCVQRFDYAVLTPFLPPKQEYVIFVSLSEVQIKMYQHYLDNFARKHRGVGGSLFADFQALQRIWTHPYVLRLNAERIEKMNEKRDSSSESEGSLKDFIDDSTSESGTSSSESDVQAIEDPDVQPSGSKDTGKDSTEDDGKNTTNVETEETAKDEEWWLQFTQPGDFEDMRTSAKLVLLFGILKESEQIGDKVLVFSQSLYSLTLIERFLDKIDDETQNATNSEYICGHNGSWSLGLDYFRLDGQTSTENRSRWCKIFNRPTNTRARLFLISTRAGGLGINLTAANRVIIFDASWNPSHDVQSIFRIYRFGQKKPCYVYRFLAAGTMEEKIYNRQVTKLSLSCRVVDEQQIERHYSNHDLSELYKLEPNVTGVKPTLNLPKDRLLAEIFLKYKDYVETYHEHDSLLENKADEELDEEERKLAWEEYEDEKKGKPIQPFNMMGMMPNNMIQGYSHIPNITNDYLKLQELIRKDYPNATPEYQKLLTTKALTDMYNYWEQQTVFNASTPQTVPHNTVPNPQVLTVAHPNVVRQQKLIVRKVHNIDSNVAGGQLRGMLLNSSGYRNVDASTSRVPDGDVIEVPPTTISTVTRPAQSAPQANSKSKNQEE